MLVLTALLEVVGQGFVEADACQGSFEHFLTMFCKFFGGVLFLVATKGMVTAFEFFFEAFHVVFAQTHAPVTTYFIAKEADVAVAVAFAISPQEGMVGFDLPELRAGAGLALCVADMLEGVVV